MTTCARARPNRRGRAHALFGTGLKAYVNERTFFRTEFHVALGDHDVVQLRLRAGLGVDFDHRRPIMKRAIAFVVSIVLVLPGCASANESVPLQAGPRQSPRRHSPLIRP